MENWALVTCILLSILGLFLLAWLSIYLEPQKIDIARININLLGKNVKICGKVDEIYFFEGGKGAKIVLADGSGRIDIYLNGNLLRNLKLENHSSLEVIGEVELYEGSIEVVPKSLDSIRVVEKCG